jgi:predicted Ser/Thr protein kinase
MSDQDNPIDFLTAAVFDGQSIDWNQVTAQSESEEKARLVRNLQFIAHVAGAHAHLALGTPPADDLDWRRLAFVDPRASHAGQETRSSIPDEATTVTSTNTVLPGVVLGRRYRIERFLGRGGMGEVWQAQDLKLGVVVALKRLPATRRDPARRDALRCEVRAARAVVSPHVCRVFDLIEIDSQELVSMEFVDGVHLRDDFERHGPRSLTEAGDIASQLLAGLQAIHDAGLVHRDLKPENILRTRTGRIVVMDFGIAKSVSEPGHGGLAGTPAYMAPEQARGDTVDGRADVYSAAIVLAELVYGATDERFRNGLHRDPPVIPDGPWRDCLRRALASHPEDRFASARAFATALEEVALRESSHEHRNPYPGLAPFTESDAQRFFGRELEIETLVVKLQRLHMLALIGPSGVGKTSLLRAGVFPALPRGWAAAFCTPGVSPFVALGQSLATEFTNDPEAVRACFRFEELDVAVSMFSRWRSTKPEALLVIDQFEELFTQNPPEVQIKFTELLGRLALVADVRVLLSLRDDFLIHCQAHPSLQPILLEMTLLMPPKGADLRRALVRPAGACGYRFEDEELVDRMVAEVENERGALPLLTFTASRLWKRETVHKAC